MAKKKSEYAAEVLGKDDYLKDVLSLIPEDKKEVILDRLGERVMARDEFSRSMDELRDKENANVAYKGTLDSWFQEKLGLLTEGEKALEELKKLKGGQQPPASDALKTLEGYIKKDEHDKIVAERIRASEEAGLNIMSTLTKLSTQYLHEYGEILDPDALINTARKSGKDIASAYHDYSAEKRAAKEQKQKEAHEAALREKWRAEWAKEQGHGVFPTAADPGIPTGLPINQEGAGNKTSRIASAIEDFHKNSVGRRAS